MENGEIGGTYMMTQKFKTNWEILGSKPNSTKEEMIGRKMFGLGIIPSLSDSSHIKRAHTLDDFPPPCNVSKGLRRIYRQSMPYGSCQTHPGREEGAFYISFAKSTTIFHDILENISGCPGTTFDAFLDVFSSLEGSFWYVPSSEELDLPVVDNRYCRVDLDEQWNVPRKNKYLFYNHKQYLHEIDKDDSDPDRVSTRVLRLLQYTFEQWNNVWRKMYLENYSRLAAYLYTLNKEYSNSQRQNLEAIKARMEHLSIGKPDNFTDAVQLIFSMHCCLHLIGQPVAVGRLDELLAPYVNQSGNKTISNQEIIDCFWIKFGERVILDPHQATDVTSWGNCAVPYTSDGNFPRGDSLNQWVQQITVGGYHSNPKTIQAMNDVTILCLKAARRLPLNAPCLSLRLHKGMNEEILQETAKSLLSGGAHPILLHDDRIIPALESSPHLQKMSVKKADIQNYASDGCFEPLLVGKSEFAFTYVPLPLVLELTINQGDSYVSAGPAFLQGKPSFYRSVSASDIKSFKHLQDIFESHLKIQIEGSLYKLLANYGNIWKACPAPLLSTLIDGCLETGRDLYNGGAKYVVAACMFIGFSNCIDALYSIKKLCFDNTSACVSLEELLLALKNDWGFDMSEPFVDDNAGIMRSAEKSTYYRSLRQRVLTFPKFGTDAGAEDKTVQELAEWLSSMVVSTFKDVVENSSETDALCQLFTRLKKEYSTTKAPFECILCPGSGTFEGYVGWGMSLGASADGRRKTMPIASDFSAAPVIQDGKCKPSQNDIYKSMKNWDHGDIKTGFSNGAEVDLNMHENFPEDELVNFIRSYANGEDGIGANLLTITCADEDTYQQAYRDSEKYDLIRVRMGDVTTKYTNLTLLNTAKQASLACNSINASLMTVTESSYAYLQNVIFSTASPAIDGWRFWTNNRASKQTYVEGQTYFTDFPLDEESNEVSSPTYCVYGVYKHSENKIGWVPAGCHNDRLNGICLRYMAVYSVTEYATMYTPKVSWQKAKSVCKQVGGVLANSNKKMVDLIFQDSVVWAGLNTFWTDNYSQKYVGELQPRPFPNDEKQDNTNCVKATYVAKENKLKWSTESCDSMLSFLCMIEARREETIPIEEKEENTDGKQARRNETIPIDQKDEKTDGKQDEMLSPTDEGASVTFMFVCANGLLYGDTKDDCIEAIEDQCSIDIPDFDSKLNGTEMIEYMTNIPPISLIGIILPLNSSFKYRKLFLGKLKNSSKKKPKIDN
ncbi:unnamed protein product [Mytilus coruscus]|uniref:C-type lectin domain-containing protein n=1 Tax=Mytilus coruscus TaxID=42192 RepID=A0A6J8AWW0_MYTCO|nr:unnamed protein product [Mytilus coruscus]